MTTWRMNLTRTDDAGPAVYQRRDALAQEAGSGRVDLYGDDPISEQLRRHAASVSGSLDRLAAKTGLKPANAEIAYGIHGAASGPIEFWVQRVFQ